MEEYQRKIDRLYDLLELESIDTETKSAIRWAIFELESIYGEKEWLF